MKLIQSKAELITQEEGLQGIYKIIESAGRTCYKSEANITEDSASEFVDRMVKSDHTAMLEHGTVYLLIPYWNSYDETDLASFFRHNPYSKAWGPAEDSVNWHITTNYRVLVENNLVEKCKPYICSPTRHHSLRISMRFVTDRGVSHELVRHRVFSFAHESTRYCNYSKDKFGGEISYIMPSWFPKANMQQQEAFMQIMKATEDYYIALLGQWDERKPDARFKTGFKDNPLTPQQARQVLPNALKTEIVMTGFTSDWKHFFDLRYFGITGKPHPDMLELTTKAKAVLEEAGLWKTIVTNKHSESIL